MGDAYPCHLTRFRPRAIKTTPGAVAYVPGTARREGADSVDQRRAAVWSGHIAHRDDREALHLFVRLHSLQDFLARGTHHLDSVVPRALLPLLDDSMGSSRWQGDTHREQHDLMRGATLMPYHFGCAI